MILSVFSGPTLMGGDLISAAELRVQGCQAALFRHWLVFHWPRRIEIEGWKVYHELLDVPA
jgi:hypothetical protein